jgi:hypothetical protein
VNGSNPEPLKSPPFVLRYLSTNGGDFSSAILNLIAMTPSVGAMVTQHTGLPLRIWLKLISFFLTQGR